MIRFLKIFEKLKLAIDGYKWFRRCDYTRKRAWKDAWWQADLILRYTDDVEF